MEPTGAGQLPRVAQRKKISPVAAPVAGLGRAVVVEIELYGAAESFQQREAYSSAAAEQQLVYVVQAHQRLVAMEQTQRVRCGQPALQVHGRARRRSRFY